MNKFVLKSEFKPTGDQPKAIEKLIEGYGKGYKYQTLLGVTGSGKTYTMANVIEKVQRPVLVIAHNKTLAGQLCSEFREFFPDNAVEYFVSYYDYYQPEAYIPNSDTYIEKDSSVNEEIDKLRHSATAALLEQEDVIIVASVSCIYGLGDPDDYSNLMLSIRPGMIRDRDEIIKKLIEIQYDRKDIDFRRGSFRVRGDTLEIFPASSSGRILRVEFFGDEIEKITEVDYLTGQIYGSRTHAAVFPASHFATTEGKMRKAVESIQEELEQRLKELRDNDKLVEAQRLEQRTRYDIEMLTQIGFCSGIENYSRHISRRKPGSAPFTLIDYFPDDFLLIIDESHVTVPQIGAMYKGDKARKENLIEYGFRLPSAYDNRPLNFDEFTDKLNQVIFVSATPADYERKNSSQIVEQIIRPTGLIDPEIIVKPVEGQIDDLMDETAKTVKKGFRVLVTTLTKKMAEDLTVYLDEMGYKVKYLHSDIDTLERMEIIKELRSGIFDILVGINLLREGLDLPEVALIAILDADKEGFLRSETSLIQTIGRAARNSEGKVIMYADKITSAMQKAISETNRRRDIQINYNKRHNITPKTIKKAIRNTLETIKAAENEAEYMIKNIEDKINSKDKEELLGSLRKEMEKAAKELRFEDAARLRDTMKSIEDK